MKRFIIVMLSLLVGALELQATWVLTQLINNSDLVFVKACRDNDIEMPSVTDLVKQAVSGAVLTVPADLLFGSLGGCKIIGQDPQGNQVSFSLLGDPTQKVANGRATLANVDARIAAATIKPPMMARVCMVLPDGSNQLIGFVGYTVKKQNMQVTFSGTNGQYQVSLQLL